MYTLISCILLNSLIGVIFKFFEKYGIDNFQAIVVNYIVCVVTAAVVTNSNPIPADLSGQPWFWFALCLGGLFIAVFNLIAITVQKTGIMVATIFQKLSLVAPAMIAIIFYNESSGSMKWAGIILSVMAIILVSYQPGSGNTNPKPSIHVWMYPIMTFIGSCFIDSSIYLVQKNNLVKEGDIGFVAALFLFAAIFGLLILVSQLLRKNIVLRLKNIIGGVCLGIPNFFSIYLLILSLQQGWDGSVVFPVNNVGVLVMAALFGIILFKEKVNAIKLTGFFLSLLAILLITFAS